MKKFISIISIMILACTCFTLFGCGEDTKKDGQADVVVTESKYVAWVNEIYANRSTYLEKTIEIEGVFDKYTDGNYWVKRNGASCCNADSWCGFILQGMNPNNRPRLNDWVRVKGIFKYDSSINYPYLRVVEFEVKNDQRGAESVGASSLI